MEKIIVSFCEEYQFPAEACGALSAAYASIQCTPSVLEIFSRTGAAYQENRRLDYEGTLKELSAACGAAGIPEETASMLLYMSLVPQMYRYYEQEGLPRELCRACLEDLKWKLFECRRVRGRWGSFVSSWFSGFFKLERFTLGRLQFELRPFPEDYEEAGRARPARMQQVINIHIPSSGPLLREDCRRSYRLAAEFFRSAFPGEETAFVCFSWLLFPAHRQFLPSHSHILEFMEDFDIYRSHTDPQGRDLWRIFGMEDCSDTVRLPEETSLQRAYKQWLLNGREPGTGAGLFVLHS